jgi:hypothetical protein
MDHIDKRLSDRIIDFLKREHGGVDRAIPYREVMDVFVIGDDGKDNHWFRKLYENRVGSCAKGIYYISTHGEALAWHGYLERTYGKDVADRKLKAFLSMRPDLKPPAAPPATQPSLFDGAGA